MSLTALNSFHPATLFLALLGAALFQPTVAADVCQFPATGTIESERKVTLAANITGRVVQVDYHAGQFVDLNTVLIKIDDSALQADLLAAQAELALAQAEVTYALGISKRMKNLIKKKSISKDRVEEAAYKLAAANAKFRLKKAHLQKIGAKLKETELRAPFAGTITERHVEVGQLTQPGSPLFVLEDQKVLVLKVRIRETEVPLISLGDSAKITLDALNDAEVQGKVHRIIPAGDKSHTFGVEISLPDHEGVYPGMFGKALIIASDKCN